MQASEISMMWLMLPTPVEYRFQVPLFFDLLGSKIIFTKIFNRYRMQVFVQWYIKHHLDNYSGIPEDHRYSEAQLYDFVVGTVKDTGIDPAKASDMADSVMYQMHDCMVDSNLDKVLKSYVVKQPNCLWDVEFANNTLILKNQGDWRIHNWVKMKLDEMSLSENSLETIANEAYFQ